MFQMRTLTSKMKKITVTILGGGIAGLATAIALRQAGVEARIFEAASEIRPVGAGLGLASNAMRAFEVLGLSHVLENEGQVLTNFSILDTKGKVIKETYFDQSNPGTSKNFVIHRANLHNVLQDQLDEQQIQLGKKAIGVELSPESVNVTFEDGTSHECNYLIVADGIHSNIRQQLIPNSKPRYANYTCWRGIVNNFSMKIDGASETWGNRGRFGIVPLRNKQVYWFACVNSNQANSAFKYFKTKDILDQFETYHTPIKQLINETPDDHVIWNDIYDLKPLTKFAFGRIVLVGDAAHATTPNMGQGACQAIEDAVILGKCVQQENDMQEAFRVFEKNRIDRTTWVVESSRKIGQVAQIENPVLISMRNGLFRSMPKSWGSGSLRKLDNIDFSLRK